MSIISNMLIIDEWLWHDLSRENGEDKLREAFKFLVFLYEKCDKLATVKNSKFEKKFFQFCNRPDSISHEIVRFYKNYIFLNSEKYIRTNEEECPEIPEDIELKDLDDFYIIKLHYKFKCPIITTDSDLLRLKDKIQCEHRDNFLSHYISK